jgi:hypothetical protein
MPVMTVLDDVEVAAVLLRVAMPTEHRKVVYDSTAPA